MTLRELRPGDWPAVRAIYEDGNRRLLDAGRGRVPENEASLRLHKACGFREVGVRERLGESGGVSRDLVLLERRSERVGA